MRCKCCLNMAFDLTILELIPKLSDNIQKAQMNCFANAFIRENVTCVAMT